MVFLLLFIGSPMLWKSRFDVKRTIASFPKAIVFRGSYYVRLLLDASFTKDVCKNSGSAPILPEIFEEFKRRSKYVIVERYGMTEGCMLAQIYIMVKEKL